VDVMSKVLRSACRYLYVSLSEMYFKNQLSKLRCYSKTYTFFSNC